jgi:DNA-directed RNA polymerase subunit RPC12/RpoP
MALFLETPRKDAKRKRDYIMKQGYTITIMTTPEDKSVYTEAKCPSCGSKVCFYKTGGVKAHRCTVCNEENVF